MVIRLILPVFFTAIFMCSAQAQTEEHTSPAMLVLDSSGSMWGKIGKKNKVSIARDVVNGMVDDWHAGVPLGLMTYGHRRKGDCSDIELLLPAKKIVRPAFKAAVRGLSPTGKTPMVQAVLNAADSLSYLENKATVILISDGEETCGLDPCAIGAALKKKGVDFTAHVIGFGVSYKESLGLQCLAEETGGRYLTAENADQLKDAINVVAQDTLATDQDKKGDATIEVVHDQVLAGTEFEVKWTGPQNKGDRLAIFSSDQKTRFDTTYIGGESLSPEKLVAPEAAGTYKAHYYTRHKKSLASDDFTVIAAKANIQTPKEPIVGGTPFKVKLSKPERIHDQLQVINDKGEEVTIESVIYIGHKYKEGTLELLSPETAGEYTLEYITRGKKVLAKDTFTVIESIEWVDAPDEPVLGGATFRIKISKPKRKSDQVRILKPNGDQVSNSGAKYLQSRYKDGFVELIAPEVAGEYKVIYFTRGKKTLAQDSFTVIAPTANLSVPNKTIEAGAKFQIHTSKPNQKTDRIEFVNEQGKRVGSSTYFIQIYFKDGIVTLPAPKTPGNYIVRYITRGKSVLAQDSLVVIPAQ